MKFAVYIALVGLATATRLQQASAISKDDTPSWEEVPPSALPPSGEQEPNESQKKLMAEIYEKGKRIVKYKGLVDSDNFKEAMKTNKDKVKEVKAQKFAEAVAAEMKEKAMDSEMTAACAAKRAQEAKAKEEKAAEMRALDAAMRPKVDAEAWVANMPAQILNGEKFGGSAPLKWAYAQQGVKH